MIEPDVSQACAEWAAEAPTGAVGWRALLTVSNEDAEDAEEVAVYCPACAARSSAGREMIGGQLEA